MKFTKFGLKLFYLFILVSLVPSGIAGVIVYKYVSDRTRENVIGQLQYEVHDLNEKLNLLLSKRRFRVADFSSDGFIRDCVEQLSYQPLESSQITKKLNHHLSVNKKDLDPDILEIGILDHKGKVIASTLQEQIGKDKSNESYFRGPFLFQEQKGSYFSDALRPSDTHDSKLELVFSSILTDKFFHKPLGVLVTKVRGEILRDILAKIIDQTEKEGFLGQKQGDDMYIVNGDKLMIAGLSETGDFSFGRIIDTMQVRETLESKGTFFGICENYRGVKAFCTALYVPETNWVILSEKEVGVVNLQLKRIQYMFVTSAGIALLLIFLIALAVSGNMSRDLNNLLCGIRRVSAGDLQQSIIIGKGNDELKEVGESFNLMLCRLKKSYESNIQLKNLDKMKDNIIKDISHELKSPLAQLRLALEIWLKRSDQEVGKVRVSQSTGDHLIEIIKSNITRLNDTVDSILTLADIESDTSGSERELLSLKGLINQIVVGQKLRAETKKLRLTSIFSENLPEVFVNKTQIARVISNLFDNAIRYTETGEIKLGAVIKNNEIEVAIKDTGIGIDLSKESQYLIFERFYQVRTNNQGVGIGLSICENIIKAHHGKIWVESEGKGKGSTFMFTLPVPQCGDFCDCV